MPDITNDIESPCNRKGCTTSEIASCCGCPEWFEWNEKRKNTFMMREATKEERQAVEDYINKISATSYGWICPKCGRGLSPFTTVCPCSGGKGWEITC